MLPKSVPGVPPAILKFECLPAGGAGTLPAEAVSEACKKQGATTANFSSSFYLQEEPVLCLRELSLKHVKNRGPLSPFSDSSFYLQEEPEAVPETYKKQGTTPAIF